MDYHVMTRELYPHGYLLETRGFFANDKAVRTLSTACPLQVISVSVHPLAIHNMLCWRQQRPARLECLRQSWIHCNTCSG